MELLRFCEKYEMNFDDMLIHAKSTIGLDVVEMTGLDRVGTVRNIVVDPDNGAILAFLLNKKHIFSKNQVVSLRDAVEFYPDGILINDWDSVVDPKEIVRVNEVMDKKINLFGSKVITQKGKILGRLDDFVFDTDMGYLATIIAKKMIGGEKRIMSSDRILSILKGKVVIRDIIEKVKLPKKEMGKWKKPEKLLGDVKISVRYAS